MNRLLLPISVALALCVSVLSSCIKEEARNAECDITSVDSLWLKTNRYKLHLAGNPAVSNERVDFYYNDSTTDRTAVAPEFCLTPGATIVPESGTVRNFTSPQTYVVTAEDGVWHKNYTVAFHYEPKKSKFSFEHYALESFGRYYEWFETDTTFTDAGDIDKIDTLRYWATGNPGYAFTGIAKDPTGFPTAVGDGYEGRGVVLTTRSTGSFGANLPDPMPIAAGNLFIGEFMTAYAVFTPRKATRFGRQIVQGRPNTFEGYYKYTPGQTVIDSHQNVLSGVRDSADIYAVVYEVNPDKFEPLDGDSAQTSKRIVAIARLDDYGTPTEWTHFSIPFRPMNGKTFSFERCYAGGYALAIVATSSNEGAHFTGAVGSQLFIDELRVTWKGEEE